MLQTSLCYYINNNIEEIHEGKSTQAVRTNLQWLYHEIQELLQLHKMPERSDCAVSMRVAATEYIKNGNEVERYK